MCNFIWNSLHDSVEILTAGHYILPQKEILDRLRLWELLFLMLKSSISLLTFSWKPMLCILMSYRNNMKEYLQYRGEWIWFPHWDFISLTHLDLLLLNYRTSAVNQLSEDQFREQLLSCIVFSDSTLSALASTWSSQVANLPTHAMFSYPSHLQSCQSFSPGYVKFVHIQFNLS